MIEYPGDDAARKAFDIMVQRGWTVQRWDFGTNNPDPFWAMSTSNMPFDGKLYCWVIEQEFPDPFTALIEADKWFKEHAG